MSNDLPQFMDFNLVNVESNTQNPIQNNLIQTLRSHDCNSIENATLLNRIENVKLKKVSDMQTDKLQTLIGINQSHEISNNLFNDSYPLINDIERLKVLLSEVNIRFDNAPKNYQKEDYFALLRVLNKSLLFLYNKINSIIKDVKDIKFIYYYDSVLSFPSVGEEYKLYVDLTTEKIYLYHNGYINIGNSSDWHDIELIDGNF